jgi:hypothetical protein
MKNITVMPTAAWVRSTAQHSEKFNLFPCTASNNRALVMRILLLVALCVIVRIKGEENLGTLVFSDDFERKATQELKDEPGNGWNTSSSWSAKGNKEVDLVDGTLHIYIHPQAIHAVDVGHAFAFTDGTAQMRFKFHEAKDTLMLNFADSSCKEVHAGHICAATFATKRVTLQDMKKSFPCEISINEWHSLSVTISGDTMKASVDGKEVGNFSSSGIAHETKQVLRLLVSNQVTIDDVKYYKLK